MNETSTTIYQEITNPTKVKYSDVLEIMDADEVIFYHAIRADLDLLHKKPKAETIDRILEYSKKIR